MVFAKPAMVFVAAIILATPTIAKARHANYLFSYNSDGHYRAQYSTNRVRAFHARPQYRYRHHHHRVRHVAVADARRGIIVGGRPHGCPHAYCGCGVSLHVFGRIRPELNLAWNWAVYFQREPSPRVGLVAVRHGHVMEIIGGGPGSWVVYDPNSGRGLTRRHVRPLKGYVFVNPHATKLAYR